MAGSRSIGYNRLLDAFAVLDKLTVNKRPEAVLCGLALGADVIGALWAICNDIPVLPYPADWKNEESPTYNKTLGYDKVAGYRRNTAMANDGDALVALWDGKSKGTMHMVNEIEKRGKPCRAKRL